MSFVKFTVIVTMAVHYGAGDIEIPAVEMPPVQHEGWSTYYDLSEASMNGKVMANGNPFRPVDITMAHRTIPLGSHVLVEHIRTQKKVWVEVTDRGPYGAIHEGKWVLKLSSQDPGEWRGVADLSIGAARALSCPDKCERPPNSHIKIRYWKKPVVRRRLVTF